MRPRQQRLEARQGVRAEAELGEAETHAGAIEHAQHDAFAMHRRHGGHAQIELAALDARLDPAVLRQPALGNVQLRQQLQSRDDGRREPRLDDFGRVDDPVDAIAHMQAVVERLEMDVRSAQVGDAADEHVDQADDRRLAGQVAQVLDEIACRCGVRLFDLRIMLPFAFQRARQGRVDLRLDADCGRHLQPARQPQRPQRELVLRRGHHHVQHLVADIERKDAVRPEETRGDLLDHRQHRRERVGQHQLQFHLRRQRVGHVEFGNQPQPHQHPAEEAARFPLRGKRALEVARGEFPLGNKALPEQESLFGNCSG